MSAGARTCDVRRVTSHLLDHRRPRRMRGVARQTDRTQARSQTECSKTEGDGRPVVERLPPSRSREETDGVLDVKQTLCIGMDRIFMKASSAARGPVAHGREFRLAAARGEPTVWPLGHPSP